MVGIGRERRRAVGDQSVGEALHALARHAEAAGDLRHGLALGRGGAEHLPARLRLADRPRDPLAGFAERAGELEQVGDDQRDESGGIGVGGHDAFMS